jgi:hypothetical protein
VPELSTLTLLGAGLAFLRRRKRAAGSTSPPDERSAAQALEEVAVLFGVLDQAHAKARGAMDSRLVEGRPPDQSMEVQRPAPVIAKRERHHLALVGNLRGADEHPSLGDVADLSPAAECPYLELCAKSGTDASMRHARALRICGAAEL